MVKGKTIYMGRYPQVETVPDFSAATTIAEIIRGDNDYNINALVYNELASLPDSAWDENGDAPASDGYRYRRLTHAFEPYFPADENDTLTDYQWDDKYHYFKHQPIKWRVLSENSDEMFLLSDMVLFAKQYNDDNYGCTWKESHIRKTLNEDFINIAFSDAERDRILVSDVTTVYNREYHTPGGGESKDRIFLLSVGEVCNNRYGFTAESRQIDDMRKCKSSSYAKATGCWSYAGRHGNDNGNCLWWLRTPGCDTNSSAQVDYKGVCDLLGSFHDADLIGVRPAMRIRKPAL